MIAALAALALAAVPDWLQVPEPHGLLRWRTVELAAGAGSPGASAEIAPGRPALARLPGAQVLRLRGRFAEGCRPLAWRRFGDGEGSADVAVPLSAGGEDLLLVPPPAVAPGLPAEEGAAPAAWRFELPAGCAPARLRLYRAELVPDEYGPTRVARELRRAAAAGSDEGAAAAWLSAPHPHRWQESAALAMAVSALLGRAPGREAPARDLVRGLAEEAVAESRAADLTFAWRTLARMDLPRRAVDGAEGSWHVLERGQAPELDVEGVEAVRLFHRVAMPPEEVAPAAWRLRVSFDGRPPLPVLALSSRDPEAPAASRERSTSLAVPPGVRRLRLEALDRQALLKVLLVSHKANLEEALETRPARTWLERAARGGGDGRGRLAALLARGRLGDRAALEEAASLADAPPALRALAAAWRAELEPDLARAEALLLRAREAAGAPGDALWAALRPLLSARLSRLRARLDLSAGRPLGAARALLGLAAEREICDEDADDLWLADAFAADTLDAGAHALGVLDGLSARRPLDHALAVSRSRAFALASYWGGLAPETEAREVAFLEESPPEQRQVVRADRFSFAPLPADGRALEAELPAPPLPGRRPVLSLLAVRGPALARAVPVRLDGEAISLPVIEPMERFDLPVAAGRHRLALEAGDFAGEILVNQAAAPGPPRLRRYLELPAAGLAFRGHEAGLPAQALVSLRVAVPAGAAVPSEVEVELEGAGQGTLLLTLRPGAARAAPRSDLGPALQATDPVEVALPLDGRTAVVRLRARAPAGVRVLSHLALRRHRPAAPAGAPAPGEIPPPPASGDGAAALAALRRESARLELAPGPAPLLARAAALAELDEIALAREDLLTALSDPALGPHQRAFVAATWRGLDEVGGLTPSSVPEGQAALSPSLALSGGRGALGPGLLSLLDDPGALSTLSAAEVRRRAGEGRDGDLAVLAAARSAAAAGQAARSAALWLDLAAGHPEAALLRRLAGEAVLLAGDAGPGPARAYLELSAAVRLDPRDAAAQRLLRRAATRTRLRSLRFADESAGSVVVRLPAAEAVEERADAAVLPAAPDAGRAALVTRERQASVSFAVSRPLRVTVRAAPVELRHNEAEALGAPPVVLEWVRDGEPPERIACPPAGGCASRPIDLAPGSHDLALRLDGGLRPVARVWVDADRPAGGPAAGPARPSPVPLDTLADHLVARPESPVRLAVHGPALVKVEVRSPLGRRAAREVALSAEGPPPGARRTLSVPAARDPAASLPDGGPVSAEVVDLLPLEADALHRLEIRPRSGEALVRLSVREAAGAGPGDPVPPTHAWRALAAPPLARPADLAAAPAAWVRDGDVAPGLDALGSLELTTGYARREENAEGAPVQTSGALSTGFTYRRLAEDLHLTWKVGGEVRVREAGGPAEALSLEAFFMHPERRWLRLQGWASGATQPVEAKRAWAGKVGLMVEPVFTLWTGLHLVSKLGGWWSDRTLRAVAPERLGQVDPDVFTPYDVSHPRALFWEEGLELEAAANAVLYANARLTTNQSLSPTDQDHVSATALGRVLFGRTYLEAQFRTTWWFVDADRPDPSRRSTVRLSAFHTLWPGERQHLVLGAWTAVHLDSRPAELGVYLSWEWSNGRRFTDHTPLEGEDYFFPQRGPGAERGRIGTGPP